MTTKKSLTDSPKNLADALRQFQLKVKAAPKSGHTTFPNKRDYSKLEDVLQIVQYAHELGISHTQTGKCLITDQGQIIDLLITTLYFGDEKIESIDRLPPIKSDGKATNTSQEDGVRRTYTKKYALSAIYGIGSDDDDDANSLSEQEDKKKNTIARTPEKPNEKPISVDSIKDKNYGTPISPNALSAVVSKMKNLTEQFPDKKDTVINKFKKQFNIKAEKIGPADIRTAEQGQFLTIAINEIDSSL